MMFKKVKLLYKRWVKVGRKIAAFQIRVLFTIAYYICIVPFGFIVKIFSGSSKTGWQKVKSEKISLEDAGRQF